MNKNAGLKEEKREGERKDNKNLGKYHQWSHHQHLAIMWTAVSLFAFRDEEGEEEEREKK